MNTSEEKSSTGYLIDPEARLVSVVSVADFKDIQKHLECDIFTTVRALENGDTLYVDDMSLISGKPQEFFMFAGYPSPIAGRGLLLGATPDGADADCETNVVDAAMLVEWLERV